MSKRKYPAAAMALLAASTLAGVGLGHAQAANAGLPFITGGGHTQNNNSGSGVDQTTFGGFNARATGAGTTTGDDDDDVTYPARGEVQGRSSADATHETVGKVHGDVVCIANLGPADADTGGQAGTDIWEIRFRVERGTAGGAPIPAGVYASLFVQDNGPHNDFADENFDPDQATNPNCGDVTSFQLEPHQGQITVHRG